MAPVDCVTVYAVSAGLIRTLCRGCPSEVAGFYQPRAGEPLIFTSALDGRGDRQAALDLDLDPQEVLFHEYSHHFMFSNFQGLTLPMWFVEGFAEFNANIVSLADGTILLGTPAGYRAYGLRSGRSLSARALFAPAPRDLANDERLEAIYGRGWLLMHFLMLNGDKRPSLNDYLKRLSNGEDSLKAGEAAFGDLHTLDLALDRYVKAKLNRPLVVPATVTTPEIEVRALSVGAAEMMPVHLRSRAGVDDKLAAQLVPQAEAIAAKYPNDVRVQGALAEAEFDAGRLAEADAACDRALATDPKDLTALLHKAKVAVSRLVAAKSADPVDWQRARSWIVKANRLDPDAAKPLIDYYASYLAQGVKPTRLAVDGLFKASALASEDKDVTWLVARQHVADGEVAAARCSSVRSLMLHMPVPLPSARSRSSS